MPLGLTDCHHSASLVMPISDPRDGFFYPTHSHDRFFNSLCRTRGITNSMYEGLSESSRKIVAISTSFDQ